MTCNSADNKQLVLVQHSGMASAALGNWAGDLRLCPVGVLEIENNQIRQVGSVLILSPEYKEFVSLVEGRRVAYRRQPRCQSRNAV